MTAILSNILILLATILLLSNSIACFRSKDLFAKIQYIKIIGFFALNLVVMAKLITYLTIAIFIKSLAIIIINVFGAILLTRSIAAEALTNNFQPDCQKISLIPGKKKSQNSEKEKN